MSVAMLTVVGSAMGEETEAAEDEDEAGGNGMVAAGFDGGAKVDEDRREANTRLSRVLAPKVGGPWLRSS